MSVLYYWVGRNYQQDFPALLQEGRLTLEQNANRFGGLRRGDAVWALTQNSAGDYVLAGHAAVDHVVTSRSHQYGRHRIIPTPGSSRFFDVEHGPSAEGLIRILLGATAIPLGIGFQGPGAVRTLTPQAEERLVTFARHLATFAPGRNGSHGFVRSFAPAPGASKSELALLELEVEAVARAVVVTAQDEARAGSRPAALLGALERLPLPADYHGALAGKRIVRAPKYLNGGNPRHVGSHGYNAYELIPLGKFGIRVEDYLARIRAWLPPKTSPSYGAGSTNHIRWDVDHGFTELMQDPFPVHGPECLDDLRIAAHATPQARPPLEANDLKVPRRLSTTTSRIVRDTETVRWLKALHGDHCQICGEAVNGGDGWTYSEGHHLRPLGAPHHGPDVAANIIILCPNHHALCDYGRLILDHAALRYHPEHPLSRDYIDYHNGRAASAVNWQPAQD